MKGISKFTLFPTNFTIRTEANYRVPRKKRDIEIVEGRQDREFAIEEKERQDTIYCRFFAEIQQPGAQCKQKNLVFLYIEKK